MDTALCYSVLPTQTVNSLRTRVRHVSFFFVDSSTVLRCIIGTWLDIDQGELILNPTLRVDLERRLKGMRTNPIC